MGSVSLQVRLSRDDCSSYLLCLPDSNPVPAMTDYTTSVCTSCTQCCARGLRRSSLHEPEVTCIAIMADDQSSLVSSARAKPTCFWRCTLRFTPQEGQRCPACRWRAPALRVPHPVPPHRGHVQGHPRGHAGRGGRRVHRGEQSYLRE
jgi:hypothetical protein